MTENDVNLACKQWLEAKGFKYKGILKSKAMKAKSTSDQPTELESKLQNTKHATVSIAKSSGFGQVPVPDGSRSVLIDHAGISDRYPPDLLWIEAKGSGLSLSELLEGFIRVAYAVWHGGGRGLLAAPSKEIETLSNQSEFLAAVSDALVGKGQLGLLDIEKENEIIL